MSRRAPRANYDEEDEFYEMERARDRRPHRRDRDYTKDVENRRRRSEPLVEDMERMHIREHPRRDFMEESFASQRARDYMVQMQSREKVDLVLPERNIPLDRDDAYMWPSGSRRRHRPRDVDGEDFVSEKRERRRDSRWHPRDIDEDLTFEERGMRGDGRHCSEGDREAESDFLVDEIERRGHRGHRTEREREVEGDQFIDERDNRRDRRRRPEPAFEEDLVSKERVRERNSDRRLQDEERIAEQERSRGSMRHPRGFEEDDLIIEDRERHRGSRRHPKRRSEDDFLYEEREKSHRRRPERDLEENLLFEERGKHRGKRHRPEHEFEEEEMAIRQTERKDPPLHCGWDSEIDIRSRERRVEFEEEELYHRPRPRPRARPLPPHRVEVEEVPLDSASLERRRGPVDFLDREFEDDDVVIRWNDKGPRPVNHVDEEEVTVRSRERRRSVPSEDLERELRGLRREGREQIPPNTELSERSSFDSKSCSRDLQEIKEDISISKSKNKHPPRQPSPSLGSIHMPPVHQGLFTHHRHSGHGHKDTRTLRMRNPDLRSQRGGFDEIEIQHQRMRGGRMSEETIALKHRDSEESLAPEDSISLTSSPTVNFKDPWERETISVNLRRPKPLEDESELAYSHGTSDASSMRDVEEDVVAESIRIVKKAPRGTDDWSVVHPPSPDEAIEMTGALGVVDVKPRHVSVDEVETGRTARKFIYPEKTQNDQWTEIAKRMVVREAIEQMGYEYEETRTCYYIFSYLKSEDIDELVELSDEIRSARRRRIRDIQQERAFVSDTVLRMGPRVGMPPHAWIIEKRMQDIRDREWMHYRR
ncbi:hypothetical protein PDIG_55030 [Penicillium digitatum PHI26]|uniref:DUF8035 domain-containing protein n=2 Tax=Penicillium digitatum TaxID=36651 RepID=K9FQW0_PEND2|nr:hypothetical protein PDIP_50240 [Penicillium digitatum Pd1]EKV10772.1 hypothetical protein PDIG_55030 [Penicillium digitatum PHI26]EKV13075.1 hypothetical protein PDIP_50240 [Penicillium digitatum Pd1]